LAGATGGLSIAIGAAGGAIIGGAKAKKNAKEREAGLQLPSGEDPAQTARLLSIDRIAKNVQAGTDPATERALSSGAETTAATQNRLARVTGGASGATVDALLKSQRAGQSAANQSIAQGQQKLPFFMNLGQQIANRAEQRKLELDLLQRAQTSAETAQEAKERNVNANAAIASGVLGSNLSGSTDRIKSLIGNFQANRSQEDGGGFVNPNANLNQTILLPQNANPSVDLGGGVEGGTEVLGTGGANLGTFGSFSGSTGLSIGG